MLRKLFRISFQRTVVADYDKFLGTFRDKLYSKDDHIKDLFDNIDEEHQAEMLMQSITLITDYSSTEHPSKELEEAANILGPHRLKLPIIYFDYWLECLLETIRNQDPEYDDNVEHAWREVMTPGIEYLKSECSALQS